jgi:transcription elongation factor Elf1
MARVSSSDVMRQVEGSERMNKHDPLYRKLIHHICGSDDMPGGVDCEICEQQFDCLAERVVAGADLRDLWPEFAEHIGGCKDCAEIFNAMLAILRAEESGELTQQP